MPRPALHGRFVPAAAKMAISGRHLQGAQGIDKTHKPIASVAALSERPVGEHSTAWGRWCTTTLPDVSLRGAKRRGNLGKTVAFSPMAFPRCGRVRRDCTPRALPRAARSGRHVGLRPPRNDKPLAFTVLSPACSYQQHCAGPGMPLPYILHICKNQGQAIGLPLCFVLLQLRVAHEDGRELCAGGIAGRLEAAVLAVDDARADAPAQRVNGP